MQLLAVALVLGIFKYTSRDEDTCTCIQMAAECYWKSIFNQTADEIK